jgi:hypothetical protein
LSKVVVVIVAAAAAAQSLASLKTLSWQPYQRNGLQMANIFHT